ncbi:A disintegrin and metalloproteinase with thrombospondin motifs adt-2 isoform X2 [Eurytemora carolleeae]|uniref:A disintegrin and metalloproteinase with thrombospondin motifs adt-2 isoform X2 n=1 Tax=Eurytemora carolleeae TaxID=1294199 RepID=UPI000C75A4B0|nr:A disintegrin and metalloproteinase with thrombospondin motifs adt-2 isoform X2 [Eurytemora carolleeae]|eukprot:XP_023326706.1 A disintegrin and metalloproteinase with thrombospondin motifs adt-2-like isoform X2 [Eurytemora affinis]
MFLIAVFALYSSRVHCVEYQNSSFSDSSQQNSTQLSAPELQERYKELDALRHGTRKRRENSAINTPEDFMRPEELAERYNLTQNHSIFEKRAADELIMELMIFSDQSFYEYVRERNPGFSETEIQAQMSSMIQTIVQSVQMYFDDPSLDMGLEIRIVDIIQLKDRDLIPAGDIKVYLENFCNYQRKQKTWRSGRWDHALLLTGTDLYTTFGNQQMNGSSGMAYLSGMCSAEYSCTIAEARSLGSTSLIVTHELAHNLGADHDGDRDNRECKREGYIMGPMLGPGANTWSSCTQRQINDFVKSLPNFRSGNCLDNTVTGGLVYNKQEMPGIKFDGEAQCNYMYGKDWHFYTGAIGPSQINDPCESLWCRFRYQLKTPNAPALQGTECGIGKVCYRGGCRSASEIMSSEQIIEQNIPTTRTTETTRTAQPTTTRSTRRPSEREQAICEIMRFFNRNWPGCN